MQDIIQRDTDAYFLTLTDAKNAKRLLDNQEVAAVITIPKDFDEKLNSHQSNVILTLNNVDIDFADDIRRSVDRSVAHFDAPILSPGDYLEDEARENDPAQIIQGFTPVAAYCGHRNAHLFSDLFVAHIAEVNHIYHLARSFRQFHYILFYSLYIKHVQFIIKGISLFFCFRQEQLMLLCSHLQVPQVVETVISGSDK